MESDNLSEENYLMNLIRKYSGKYTQKDLIDKIKIDYIKEHKGHNNGLSKIEKFVTSMINNNEIELRELDDAFKNKICYLKE